VTPGSAVAGLARKAPVRSRLRSGNV